MAYTNIVSDRPNARAINFVIPSIYSHNISTVINPMLRYYKTNIAIYDVLSVR